LVRVMGSILVVVPSGEHTLASVRVMGYSLQARRIGEARVGALRRLAA